MQVRFKIPEDSPLKGLFGVLVLLSFVGIFTIMLSKNVALKRVIAPATFIAFHVAFFVGLIANGVLSENRAYPFLAAVALTVNAVVAYRGLRYCDECGATFSSRDPSERRCPACRTDA
jgi:hypothetical protein